MRLLLAPLLGLSISAAAGTWDARLTSVAGEVVVFTAEDAEGAPAVEGMPLENGDRVVTGAGASAELAYDGEGVVALEPGTTVTVSSLDENGGELSLSWGALVAKFHALTSGRRFGVRTPTAVAAVRGTEFGVEVDGEETGVGVFDEGHVAVSDAQGREEVVGPNQETRVRRGQAPSRAAALKRFERRRAALAGLRRRHAGLRKKWKALSTERRRALRAKMAERMRQGRERRSRPARPVRRGRNGGRP